MKQYIIPLVIASTFNLLSQAQNTQKLSTSKANEYGLTYSLPSTVIDITLEATHTKLTPGQFYNYANRYLGISNVIVAPSTTAQITNVVINPRGVANPEEAYLVKFKTGSNVSMTLTDAGLPLAINTDQIPAVAVKKIPIARKAEPTALEGNTANQAITQEMSATSSLSKKAQLAAQRIFELRETRNDLLSGQAENMPPDGQAMKLILDNINTQEAALMAMFTGTTSTFTTIKTITVNPTLETPKDTIIARLSPINGIVDVADLSGQPIRFSLTNIVRGELPLNDKGQPRAIPKGGVIYNIPGSATISVSVDGKELISQPIEISQFGMEFGLDPSLFTDKKSPYYVTFSPLTGAIIKLDISNE